jgi:hypothetical protein
MHPDHPKIGRCRRHAGSDPPQGKPLDGGVPESVASLQQISERAFLLCESWITLEACDQIYHGNQASCSDPQIVNPRLARTSADARQLRTERLLAVLQGFDHKTGRLN